MALSGALAPRDSTKAVAAPPAYWCAHWLVVSVEGPEGRIERIIQKPLARLGNHAGCEIVLGDPRVVGRSLYLHATDAGVYCVRLPRSVGGRGWIARWLRPNEVARFGPYRIVARLAGADTSSVSPPRDLGAKGTIPPPHPLLAVSIGGEELATCRLTRRLTILGSHPSSNIQLKNAGVSESQLALYWTPESLWAIDLLGRFATLMRGRPIEAVRLEEHQTLSLGEIEVTHLPDPNVRGALAADNVRDASTAIAPGLLQEMIAAPSDSDPLPEREKERTGSPLSCPVELPPSPRVAPGEDPDALFARITDRLIETAQDTLTRRRRLCWLAASLSCALGGAGIALAYRYAGALARWWIEHP